MVIDFFAIIRTSQVERQTPGMMTKHHTQYAQLYNLKVTTQVADVRTFNRWKVYSEVSKMTINNWMYLRERFLKTKTEVSLEDTVRGLGTRNIVMAVCKI